MLAAPASSPHVVAVYLTLSDSTDRWTDRGHSVRPSAAAAPWAMAAYFSFLPSFPPSLSCQTFAKAGQIGRVAAGGRGDDEIISASEWIAVPQSDIARSVARSLDRCLTLSLLFPFPSLPGNQVLGLDLFGKSLPE